MKTVVEILSNYAANGIFRNIEASTGEGSPALMYHMVLCCNTKVLLTKIVMYVSSTNDKVFLLLLY